MRLADAERCNAGVVIIDAAWYVEGRRTLETDSIEKLAAERGGTGFGWLGLRMPTEMELDEVRDAFELPSWRSPTLATSTIVRRWSVTRDCLLTVVPTARYVDELEEVEFGELFFYAGPDYILTVRYGRATRRSPACVTSWRTSPIVSPTVRVPSCRPLLHVVESYEPVIDGLEHDVREVERDVFSESASNQRNGSTSSSARCSTSSLRWSRCRRRSRS